MPSNLCKSYSLKSVGILASIANIKGHAEKLSVKRKLVLRLFIVANNYCVVAFLSVSYGLVSFFREKRNLLVRYKF
jgi:hypothetical protein